MKVLYLDCFSGASGDMLLGALIDLGVKLSTIEWELGKLELEEHFHLHADREKRQSIEGIKFTAHGAGAHECAGEKEHKREAGKKEATPAHSHAHHDEHGHGHDHVHDHSTDHGHNHDHEHHGGEERSFQEIKKLIRDSGLSDFVKERATAIFQRVALVEAKVHGVTPEKVTFHEVGALDSIIDIVGFCVALEKLGQPQVLASPLVDGTGWVECAHGRYPVPTTATLELLKGIPLTQCDEPHEMITPTGAAILAEFATSFATMQELKVERIGYGLGTRHLESRPNVLRAVLGEQVSAENAIGAERDTVALLETNLDDCTGEVLGAAQEKLFAAGALDVWMQPIQMKKNRPGVLLSVLAEPAKADTLVELILTQTTAFGLRRSTMERTKLRREMKTVTTEYGPVEVKLGYLGKKLAQVAPEFESCRKAAEKNNVAVQKIYEAARKNSQN
jgi:uncharacterized protein (TIGR00299 family) protein